MSLFWKGFLGQHARWKHFARRRDISLFVHQSEYCAATDPTNDGETGLSKNSPVLDHPIFVCQVTRNFDLYRDFLFLFVESSRKNAFHQKNKEINKPRPLDLRQGCHEEQQLGTWPEGLHTTLGWAELFSWPASSKKSKPTCEVSRDVSLGQAPSSP